MILYILLSIVTIYFIISILKKKLPLPTRYENYIYEGKRAIFLSLFFLFFCLSFIFFNIGKSDLNKFLISLLIGVPIAFILHLSLLKVFRCFGIIVPEKTKTRKITVSNLILYGILGIFIGFIFFFPTNFVFNGIFNLSFNAVIIIYFLIFIIIVVLTAWLGARSVCGGYTFIGLASKSNTEKIKEILEKNNILYIMRALVKNNETATSDNQSVEVLINEGYENKAIILLDNLIDIDNLAQ